MQIKTVKKLIKNKFGTMSKFAELIKIDSYDLQKFFAAASKKMTPEREKYLQTLESLVKTTAAKSRINEISPELRKKIEAGINEYGGVLHFCLENPQFNHTSVYHIIQGRRKKITFGVKRLLNILKIESNGEQAS
jgi:hypothetical protein